MRGSTLLCVFVALLTLTAVMAVEIDTSFDFADTSVVTNEDFTAILEETEYFFSHLNETTHDQEGAIEAMAPFASAPLFKQCDSRWGSQQIGTCSKTICKVGCAMSSIAMYLVKRGYSTNPSQLDKWLTSHGGYAGGCNIYWGKVNGMGGVSYVGKQNPTYDQTCAGIKRGSGIIANVNSGRHWVLLTGCKGNNVYSVNDPGFSKSTYTHREVVQMAVYH